MNLMRAFNLGVTATLLGFFVPTISWAAGETVLGLPKIEVLYQDPEKALKDGKPVRIERDARYIAQWGLWLLAERHYYYEGGSITVSLRDKEGKIKVAFPQMTGPFVISETEKRILDCGMSAHTEVESAVLFDSGGKTLKKIPKVIYTRNCGRTNDGRLFWLHYNAIENRTPFNVVRFIDGNGNIVHETKQSKAGTVSFTHSSRSYAVSFPEPDYPG